MKRPSFQFYPGDWLNDAALRMCSVGARGLWIDMLCLMHQGSEYGYLKVNHKVILPSNLARMVGSTLQETEGWLEELEGAGVFSKDETGCIFSRRMIRDEEIRQARAAGGIKGGNPALKAAKEGSEKVDDKVNLPPNLQPTPSSSSSSSNNKKDLSSGDADDHEQPDDKQPKPKADRIPYDEIFDLYNEIVAGPFNRPAVKIRNDSRKRAIKKIWNLGTQTKTLPWWEDLFVRATHNQRWMNGGPGKDGTFWEGANFDFLLREDNFVKIVE